VSSRKLSHWHATASHRSTFAMDAKRVAMPAKHLDADGVARLSDGLADPPSHLNFSSVQVGALPALLGSPGPRLLGRSSGGAALKAGSFDWRTKDPPVQATFALPDLHLPRVALYDFLVNPVPQDVELETAFGSFSSFDVHNAAGATALPGLTVSVGGYHVRCDGTAMFAIDVQPIGAARAWRVFRRYNDFWELNRYLRRSCNVDIPGFPRKHLTRCTGSRLEKRQAKLERWLQKVCLFCNPAQMDLQESDSYSNEVEPRMDVTKHYLDCPMSRCIGLPMSVQVHAGGLPMYE